MTQHKTLTPGPLLKLWGYTRGSLYHYKEVAQPALSVQCADNEIYVRINFVPIVP